MDRRDVLKYLLGTAGGVASGLTTSSFLNGAPLDLFSSKPLQCGWVDDERARDRYIAVTKHPFLSQLNGEIRGTGSGKIALLWKFFEQITRNPLEPHTQTIGDCVSHSFGLGIDVLTAVQILLQKRYERWLEKCATEVIYAGARIEVAEGRLRGDGCEGVWAAEFIKRWGVLLRKKYLDYDFTTYDGKKAREMGKRGNGVPNELESLCRLHPVKTCTIVRSWEECRDVVANGYPVAMSSSIGFNSTRDKDGFLRKSRKSWLHSMLIAGIDDDFKRPGALVINSWGEDWVSGPTRHDQPAGSFWVDAKTIDLAMKQGASIALSNYKGYPRANAHDYFIY